MGRRMEKEGERRSRSPCQNTADARTSAGGDAFGFRFLVTVEPIRQGSQGKGDEQVRESTTRTEGSGHDLGEGSGRRGRSARDEGPQVNCGGSILKGIVSERENPPHKEGGEKKKKRRAGGGEGDEGRIVWARLRHEGETIKK